MVPSVLNTGLTRPNPVIYYSISTLTIEPSVEPSNRKRSTEFSIFNGIHVIDVQKILYKAIVNRSNKLNREFV